MISSSGGDSITLSTSTDERFELIKAALPAVIAKAGKNDTAQDIALKAIEIADQVLLEK